MNQNKKLPQIKKSRWYFKWWGVGIILLVLLIVSISFYFYDRVLFYKKAIESGGILLGGYSAYEGGVIQGSDESITREDLESGHNPSIGADNPVMTMVLFSDFNCPYCYGYYPVLRQFVLENNEKTKLIFRDFPLDDDKASLAANCAFAQGRFWQMHDKLFSNQSELDDSSILKIAEEIDLDLDKFNNCYLQEEFKNDIGEDFLLGVRAGVSGTPTLFINGSKFPGVMSKNILEQILAVLENEPEN